MRIPRHLRASLIISGAWALMWAVYGLLIWLRALAEPGVLPDPQAPLALNAEVLLQLLRRGAVYGAVSGAAFAVVLRWAERGQHAQSISWARGSLWGAVAGVAWMPLMHNGWGAALDALLGAPPGDQGLRLLALVLRNAGLGIVAAVLSLVLARREDPPARAARDLAPSQVDRAIASPDVLPVATPAPARERAT